MSIPAGGPATIYGIGYQMLLSLFEASQLTVKSTDINVHAGTGSAAFLILEPRGGGGDTLIVGPSSERVVQIKAKADGGTWSLRDVIQEVIPDLYKGVRLGRDQVFEFSTEGRMGNWDSVDKFFKSLRAIDLEPAATIIERIDNAKPLRYAGSLEEGGPANSEITGRELFLRIRQLLRDRRIADEDDDTVNAKICYLLGRFEFRGGRSYSAIKGQLATRLLTIIDRVEDVDDKLYSMMMDLAERAMTANARIDPHSFFSGHGLGAVPITEWSAIIARSRLQIERTLTSWEYNAAEDVRSYDSNGPEAVWPRDLSLRVVTGEVGFGKTWKISSLASAISLFAPTLLIRSNGDVETNLQRVADVFWQNICGHDGVLSLDRIAERVRQFIPNPDSAWLYVLVDNVQSGQEAQALRERLSIPGVRVAFTMPTYEAVLLGKLLRTDLKTEVLDRFSETELREYVAGSSALDWHAIPPDVRQVIRIPLLARIYKDVSRGEWKPENEYELYDAYYRLRLEARANADSPTAITRLNQLALAAWDGKLPPWSLGDLEELHFTSEVISFLLRTGWIVKDDQQRFRFSHDRFLAWQTALALRDALLSGQRGLDEVGSQCSSTYWSHAKLTYAPFGYVPMDLLWLLSQSGPDALNTLVGLLGHMEDGAYENGYAGITAYCEQTIPGLGPSIAPAAIRRMFEDSNFRSFGMTHEVAKAISKLHSNAIHQEIARLVDSKEESHVEAAFEIIKENPYADAIEPLWSRIRFLTESPEIQNTEGESSDLDISIQKIRASRTLKTCIVLSPNWVNEQIELNLENPEYLDILVDLLSYLPDGAERWALLKREILAHSTAEVEWAIIGAIYRLCDGEETGWLLERMGTRRTNRSAFQALVRTNPSLASENIVQIAAEDLALTRSWTLDPIMVRSPDQVAEKLAAMLVDRRNDLWEYVLAFSGRSDLIPLPIFEFIVEELSERILIDDIKTLHRHLELVGSVARPDLIRHLHNQAGGRLESELLARARSRASEIQSLNDHWLGAVEKVLYRINGSGLIQLVNDYLVRPQAVAVRHGVFLSQRGSNDETIHLLENVALSDARDKMELTVSREAVNALAFLGAWNSVVKAYVKWHKDLDREIVGARQGLGPLSDDDMSAAFEALRTNPLNPGAVMALGFGQRTDWIDHILECFSVDENGPDDGDLVNACAWALVMMPELPDRAVEMLTRKLASAAGRRLTISTLIKTDTDLAASALLEFLKAEFDARPGSPVNLGDAHLLVDVAEFVLENDSTSQQAIEVCRARVDRSNSRDFLAEELVRELGKRSEIEAYRAVVSSPRAISMLEEEAFREDSRFRQVGNKSASIEGIASVNKGDGYTAALRLLKNPDGHDREYAPFILVDLDKERAFSDLIQQATTEKVPLIRTSIAWALIEANCVQELIELSRSTSQREREVACFMLGYALPCGAVLECLRLRLDDSEISVYEAAISSLLRLRNTEIVNELVDAATVEQSIGRKWQLAELALDRGDPGSKHRHAPKWVERLLDGMEPLAQRRILQRNAKASEKLGGELVKEKKDFFD